MNVFFTILVLKNFHPSGNSSPFCEPGSVDVFLTCTFSMLFSKELSDLSSVCYSGRLQQHEDQQPSSSESSQSDLYERYLCIYKLWKPVMWQVAQFFLTCLGLWPVRVIHCI